MLISFWIIFEAWTDMQLMRDTPGLFSEVDISFNPFQRSWEPDSQTYKMDHAIKQANVPKISV
jgi:hypothetical protein